MIKISKQNNSLIVEGIDNVFYPNNGDNSYPLNSLIVVTDNSDMATFRSVATNDVLFSGLIQNITINGEAVTKDNIIQKFDAVSNSSTGGGGGSTVDAYTKEEADNKFASKDELTNVQTVANDADTKVDALTTRVEGVETTMNDKQDVLVSGTNIKTINNQSILGEGNIEISDYYTKTEADEIFATTTQVNHQAADIAALQTDMRGKQATLVSGENIKTINGESVLGEGNIEVAKKTDIPSTDNLATKDELTAVETVANNADAKADAATSRVESVETALNNKQDTLVSGTNIKTINSQSILGSGDLTISGVSEEQAQEIAKIPTLETEIAQKANASDVPTVQTNHDGTNKNYIYSSYSDRNYSVYSNFYFRSYANSMSMEGYLWGKDQSWIQIFQIPLVTTSKAGVMSAADKTKLDSIPETIPSQTEIDGIAADVSALETSLGNKQDTLVSGTNIKTINNQSILGEGNLEIIGGEVDLTNYYTKTEADGKFATITGFNEQAADISALQTAMDGKQATLVSGENIKTINGESILGTGDIQINAGAKLVNIGNAPFSNFYNLLSNAVSALNNGTDYTDTYSTMNETTCKQYYDLFNTLKNGDLLSQKDIVFGNIFKVECNPISFKHSEGNNAFDIPIKYLGDFSQKNFINYTRDIYVHYYFYKSSSSGKIGQVELKVYTKKAGPSLQKNDFKTINGESLIGEGNIEVSGVSEEQAQEIAKIPTLETAMNGKQDTLVSGTNIKTINGNSILGEGNLVIEGGDVDLSNYYNKTEVDTKLDTKQNTLVSGTNIKTINNESVLGEGNIEVTIPDATTATSGAMSAADKTKLDSISNEWTGTQSEYDALTTKDNNTIYYVTE